MQTRNSSIDALKAFAIFLVVLGHIIQYSILDFDANYVFKLIYSFHMPLFIFISGYLAYRKDVLAKNYIKRRFLTLLIPYFSWVIIGSFIQSLTKPDVHFLDILFHILVYPDNSLWFLWVLFWMHFVFFLCEFLRKTRIVLLMLFFSFFVLSFAFILKLDNVFSVKSFGWLFPFFIGGYAINKYESIGQIIFKQWYWTIIPFLFLSFFWERISGLNFQFYYTDNKIFILSYKIVTAVFGIVFFWGLFQQQNKYYDLILNIGRNSIVIYVLNFYCISIFLSFIKYSEVVNFFYLYSLVLALVICCICIIIGFVVKKNKTLSFLLMGNI